MSNQPAATQAELSRLHARSQHLELQAIEAAVHLRATRRELQKLEARAQSGQLTIAERTQLTILLEREARLRGQAADVAQESRAVQFQIRTREVQRTGEVLRS